MKPSRRPGTTTPAPATHTRNPLLLPQLPPAPRSWCIASSAAAAISYADRGASAIVASQLLESGWTEGQLGGVQGSFFAGYALTQVLGGLLGGGRGRGTGMRRRREKKNGELVAAARDDDDREEDGGGNYRSVVPISLSLTAIATLLFPMAAEYGGSTFASIDRFCLGLAEGLLLPAAMAGVSYTTRTKTTMETLTDTTTTNEDDGNEKNNEWKCGDDNVKNNSATASSVVIAGCYLGSAWAYLSAMVLFSEQFQATMLGWMGGWGWLTLGRHPELFKDIALSSSTIIDGHQNVIVWPWVFYLNGFVSLACIFLFRDEFDFSFPFVGFREGGGDVRDDDYSEYRNGDLWKNALSIWYLSQGRGADDGNMLSSTAFLFGMAQTVSALSLGAVSVSHLDVASPSSAGAVYALGNVAAAASGSVVVNLFGRFLEQDEDGGTVDRGGDEFALPFRAIAILSAVCSLFYGCTVETEFEIGFNETAT
ncbi:hypothetical protein ACHAXA_009790 [Cyclostephanos tholiformis]|uniref:Uncharacterized protein n=1 Tax=Cyclostephanos tholiformis TaxID=382380 RepID=A0ABD3RXI1_9STRA